MACSAAAGLCYACCRGFRIFGDVVDAWYAEINSYHFDRPGWTLIAGHATQLLWKDTSRLGERGLMLSSRCTLALVFFGGGGKVTTTTTTETTETTELHMWILSSQHGLSLRSTRLGNAPHEQ